MKGKTLAEYHFRSSNSALPSQGLIYRSFGQPCDVLSLEELRLPPLADGHVRIRMLASPINPSDLLPVTGAYAARVQPPQIAGYDGVGVIVDAKGCSDLIGQFVVPFGPGGTWARLTDRPFTKVAIVPGSAAAEVSALGMINPATARTLLDLYPPADQHVIITAGASYCAMLLGQWARHGGARKVTAIVRSRTHMQRLRALHFDVVDEEDDQALAAASVDADIVFEAVGGALFDKLTSSVRPQCRIVSYGLLSQQQPTARTQPGQLVQFRLRDQIGTQNEWQSLVERCLWQLAESTVPDAESFPLWAWQEGLARFSQPGRTIKPVLLL